MLTHLTKKSKEFIIYITDSLFLTCIIKKGGVMKKNYPRFTLRVSKELLDKLTYTAELNGRTKNREIEYVLKRYMSDYERLYGKIKMPEEEQKVS